GEVKVCKQRLRERGGVSVGQGLQADRRMREESASPTGSVIEELGPGETDHHDRYVSGMSRQIFDEVQKARIRPMQVFEDEERRPIRGKTLEQPSSGKEEVVTVEGRLVDAEAGEQRDVAGGLVHLICRQMLRD